MKSTRELAGTVGGADITHLYPRLTPLYIGSSHIETKNGMRVVRLKTAIFPLDVAALFAAYAAVLLKVDTAQRLAGLCACSTTGGVVQVGRERSSSFHDPALETLQQTDLKNYPTLAPSAAAMLSARANPRGVEGKLALSLNGSWETGVIGRHHALACAANDRGSLQNLRVSDESGASSNDSPPLCHDLPRRFRRSRQHVQLVSSAGRPATLEEG